MKLSGGFEGETIESPPPISGSAFRVFLNLQNFDENVKKYVTNEFRLIETVILIIYYYIRTNGLEKSRLLGNRRTVADQDVRWVIRARVLQIVLREVFSLAHNINIW